MYGGSVIIWIYFFYLSHNYTVLAVGVVDFGLSDGSVSEKGNDITLQCDVTITDSDGLYTLNVFKGSDKIGTCFLGSEFHQCTMQAGVSTRYSVSYSSPSMLILIRNVQISDGGNWYCGFQLKTTTLFSLNVYTFPKSLILSGNTNGGDLQNVNVTLHCQTSNCVYPAPSQIQWFYNKASFLWILYKTVTPSGSQTSCGDSEKMYSATLQLPRYSIWPLQPSNVETTLKFQCTLDFPSLQSPLKSAESGNVSFAVQVSSVTLKDGSNTLSESLQVISGVAKTLKCETSVSRPAATVVWYIGTVENRRSNSSTSFTLIPQNSDHNKQIFCKAFNIQPESQAVASNKATLHVQDAAINMSFYIEGHAGETTVTVDEHDAEKRFECIVESKLTPSIKIIFEHELVKDMINESSLSFIRKDVSCFDSGVYMCEGRNYYRRSSSFITLFVRCSPRPYRQIIRNIESSLYVPVTLSFTALAYPEPGPKGFSWEKNEDEDWQPLLSNADLKISSSGQQSNLTIMNVSNADFGIYRISVTNEIGTYKQSFNLNERGIPKTNIENSTVTSNNAAIIVAITLGVISVTAIIYASYITVSRNRLKRKGKSSRNVLSSQTTYDNQTFDVSTGREYEVPIASGEAATLQQYTDLIQCSSTDKHTYAVIKSN